MFKAANRELIDATTQWKESNLSECSMHNPALHFLKFSFM
jgi:hypothetical protein